VATVDTNVRRVLGRLFQAHLLRLAGARTPTERDIQILADSLVPLRRSAAWNQAIMDLGAQVCTAQQPACLICPVEAWCEARHVTGVVDLPWLRPRPQTKYQGSRRYYRGRILAVLRGCKPHPQPLSVYEEGSKGEVTQTSPLSASGEEGWGVRSPSPLFSVGEGQGEGVYRLPDSPEDGIELRDLVEGLHAEGNLAGDAAWLEGILQGLARDGLVVLERDSTGRVTRVSLPGPRDPWVYLSRRGAETAEKKRKKR